LNVIVFVAKEFKQNEFEIYNINELLNETGDEHNFQLSSDDDDNTQSAFVIPSSLKLGICNFIEQPGSFCNLMKYCWYLNASSKLVEIF
jgi:hypothetical protein